MEKRGKKSRKQKLNRMALNLLLLFSSIGHVQFLHYRDAENKVNDMWFGICIVIYSSKLNRMPMFCYSVFNSNEKSLRDTCKKKVNINLILLICFIGDRAAGVLFFLPLHVHKWPKYVKQKKQTHKHVIYLFHLFFIYCTIKFRSKR